MADNGVSAAQLEWMQQGLQIARERLGHPVGLEKDEIARLGVEIGLREQALRGIETGELTGAVLVMGRYMVRMADLHIAWYGREIDDAGFYAGARAARAALIEELRHERV